MIIDNFHIVRVAVVPAKANAPLIVYPDAVLTFAIALQRLEPISWRHRHLPKVGRGMQDQQFAAGVALDVRRKSSRGFREKNPLGL